MGDPYAILRAMGEDCPPPGQLDPRTARDLVIINMLDHKQAIPSDIAETVKPRGKSTPWRPNFVEVEHQWGEISRLRKAGHSEIHAGAAVIRFAPRERAA